MYIKFFEFRDFPNLDSRAQNFAIDISRLIKDNIFHISRVIPFDMFPQTRHVEVLGILDLVNE